MRCRDVSRLHATTEAGVVAELELWFPIVVEGQERLEIDVWQWMISTTNVVVCWVAE